MCLVHQYYSRKKWGNFFNSESLNLSLPSISSLSVWSLLLDSLPFLLIRGFHNSGPDRSLEYSQLLTIVTLMLIWLILVNFQSALLTTVERIGCLLTMLLTVNRSFKAKEIKYSKKQNKTFEICWYMNNKSLWNSTYSKLIFQSTISRDFFKVKWFICITVKWEV